MAYERDSIEGRFMAGDEDAVAEVTRWIARVLSWPGLWRMRNELPDLHQEILLRVTESLEGGRFDPTQNFAAYVHGIAKRTAKRALHYSLRRPNQASYPFDAVAATDDGDRTEQVAIARDLARQALSWSSTSCRQVIQRYFFEERNYAEIAEEFDVPVGTVKSRLFRCLQAVHRMLTDVSVSTDVGPEP